MAKKANLESREAKQHKQQQQLEVLIRDLERELSEGKSQVEALEETHKRLRETERICQELAQENHRLSEEIAGWKERIAKSEENERQVAMLRQQLDQLQAEHARAVDGARRMQEEFSGNGNAGVGSSTVENNSTDAAIVQSAAAESAPALAGSDIVGSNPTDSTDASQKSDGAFKGFPLAWNRMVRDWRIGAAFAGVVLLIIIGAIAMKGPSSDASFVRDATDASGAATFGPLAEPVSAPPQRAAARVRGAFQTVRATQVFSEPSEESALVVNIAKGTKVNVVDSKDGWLEIRSKHGRPPGFIRQDTAARIGSN